MSVMRDWCSRFDSRENRGVFMYVKRGYVNREVKTQPGLLGTSFGCANSSHIEEFIVFCE